MVASLQEESSALVMPQFGHFPSVNIFQLRSHPAVKQSCVDFQASLHVRNSIAWIMRTSYRVKSRWVPPASVSACLFFRWAVSPKRIASVSLLLLGPDVQLLDNAECSWAFDQQS
ncbi:uncharacterized protein LOC143666354 [Tamandua tetradactyla]|uniref:uncharacterized protein LOC143666354 n=1 Tax=Tamandua tetradactyla TaxID=48850 RepID=UPI00405408AF